MSDVAIRSALENHLAAMTPSLPTVWQNRPTVAGFDANKAHQKAFLLRSPNRSRGLTEKTTLHSGIFQVNLCYPAGIGASVVEARGEALQQHFKGVVLDAGGVKVRVRGMPSIADPISITPYVVPVSIYYESIIST